MLSSNPWTSLRLGLNKTDGLLYAIKTYTKEYLQQFDIDSMKIFVHKLSDETKYIAKYYNTWKEGDNMMIVVRQPTITVP